MELYVHLPFCARKCRYCDFASYAGRADAIPSYVDAVLAEARAEAEALGHPGMETVFLGGGTPSLLPPEQLRRLLTGLRSLFPFAADAEITSEANPGTLTGSWLEAALACGVNRLSLGMQAYQPRLLRLLGRIHSYDQVCQSVEAARAAGVCNLSLDLMFGLPGQTAADWAETLDAALALAPQHLSCYGLIPEEGTPLKADLDAGRCYLPDEDVERAMYDAALDTLSAHDFRQYEISNFARPGYACRHNLGYWRQVPYLGLGAAASSMLPFATPNVAYIRRTNPADLDDYLDMAREAAWHARTSENISPAEAQFETMMLGLRTTMGVSEEAFLRMHGISLAARYGQQLAHLAEEGLVTHVDSWWRLTRRGMDVQNAVLVTLMD